MLALTQERVDIVFNPELPGTRTLAKGLNSKEKQGRTRKDRGFV